MVLKLLVSVHARPMWKDYNVTGVRKATSIFPPLLMGVSLRQSIVQSLLHLVQHLNQAVVLIWLFPLLHQVLC